MESNKNARYTVARATFQKKDGGYRKGYLILDGGVPALDINMAIMLRDKDYPRSPSTPKYHLAKYLNYLSDAGVDYRHVTMKQIYTFLYQQYSATDMTYATLRKYIDIIGRLYENLALFGEPLDQSLSLPWPGTETRIIKNARLEPLTKIWYLKYMFKPKKSDAWLRYTKWYTAEQYKAIATELKINYRIIFLITVYLGYRCDSAISVKLSDINLRTREIKPSHTKTGQMHVVPMPPELAQLIRSYAENERAKNPGADSEQLFLNNRGNPVSYHNFYYALNRAAEKVRQKHPELGLGPVHTHAGRSTFAAALRSYQLREQRLGHETFSDYDFCMLMDWKSLKNLKYYDKATRIQETAEIHEAFQGDFDDILAEAQNEIFRQQ